jgi:hypothetical protein
MILIVVYVGMVVIGEFIAFGLGRVVDAAVPSWSMMIYMGMFFGVLWAAWPLAVFVTEKWVIPSPAK